MDGQNGGSEPMNPQNPEGVPVTPAPENGGGAIFSDPNLTIEKDAIPEDISTGEIADAQASTANAADDASRVAAAFASTDASQNAALAPNGSNAITQSTATGDIKLARAPRKKMGKMPLIIGIGVVAIIAIVVILLVTRGDSGDLKQSFAEYYEYSQRLFGEETEADNSNNDDDGEDDIEWRSEEELLALGDVEDEEPDDYDDLEESEDGEEEDGGDEIELSSETIVELHAKFDKFKQVVDANKSAKLDGIREKVKTLNQYIEVAERAIAPEIMKTKLISAYDDGGEDAVKEIIEAMMIDDPHNGLYNISELEVDYFLANTKFYADSKRIGCVQDGAVDYDCVEKFYDSDKSVIDEQAAMASDTFWQLSGPNGIAILGENILNLNSEINDELERL